MSLKQLTPEALGTYIGMAAVIGCLCWLVYILIKYKPVQIIVRRWENVKYLIKQLILMYSDQPSIFAKKRAESGIAFFFLLGTTASFIWYKRVTLDAASFLMVTAPVAAIAGWSVKLIQDEKRMNKESRETESKSEDEKSS